MELADSKFYVRWVTNNGELDSNTMKLLQYASRNQTIVPVHRNRVRLALSPILYIQESVDDSQDGLDAFERDRLIASLPAAEAAKGAFGEPRFAYPAEVFLWDGAVRKPDGAPWQRLSP